LKILGIDTSSKFLNIALSENKDIIRERSYLLDRKHARQLVPRIKELLDKSGVPIARIDAFIIGIGPGSFTGLRIGVSTIKGFSLALGKPCIGVASMDSIACNVEDDDKNIIPVIDAKRGQVYSAIYRRKAGKITRLSDYMVLPIDKLIGMVKTPAVFLGDGLLLYKNNISDARRDSLFLEEKHWYPGAGNLIKLGFSKAGKTKKTSMAGLTPLYLYPEDCQVRKS
jgi:tRNA threonylcarbamoyladenosine biosynthesis protein TsaB